MTTTPVAPRTTPHAPPALHYLVVSAQLVVKNPGFAIFAVALPVILYVVFQQVFGRSTLDGLNWPAMVMVSMAAYGALGAALSGGAQLAVERRSGWLRQLTLTSLTARSILWAKAGVIMLLVLPALGMVYAAGYVLGGVRAPVADWLVSIGLMWVALVPLTVLGVALGLWVRAEAVQGLTTLVLLLLALLGGLWFPVQTMPAALQAIARATPSYWVAELGRFPFVDGAPFPWTGIAVLAGWTAALTVLGVLGYRRAAEHSTR